MNFEMPAVGKPKGTALLVTNTVVNLICLFLFIMVMQSIHSFICFLLCVPAILLVLLVWVITFCVLIYELIRHKRPARYRVFALLAPIIMLLTAYGLNVAIETITPLVPRLRQWTAIVEKIHAGEITNADRYKKEYIKYSFDIGGEKEHEDVFFLFPHTLMTVDKTKGYLYSEDDICDVRFGDSHVSKMELVMENWYYVEIS